MKSDRQFEMIYLLMEQEGLTAEKLAEHFEVSIRTIYRDVDTLSGAGIPVYACTGRNGGIRLMPDFVLNKSLLSETEQNEILFGLQSLKATGAAQGGELLSRLSRFFHKEETEWINVDFAEWGSGVEDRIKFGILKTGILEKRIAEFTYNNSVRERSDRRVEPVRLTFKQRWYLQAYCLDRKEFRTFKLSRMENVRLDGEHFRPRAKPLPPLEPPSGSRELIQVELLFSPGAAYRVLDEFSRSQLRQNSDGSFTVHIAYLQDDWLCGYLLSFGDDLRVVSPPRLQQLLKSKAQNIANFYPPSDNMTCSWQICPDKLNTSTRKDVSELNVEIAYQPEFTVAGRLGEGASDAGPGWIVPLWDAANAGYGKVEAHAVKTEDGAPKMWGIMGNADCYLGRWTERGLYLAGCETEPDAPLPEGWTKWTVPAQTYLVTDITRTSYGEVFSKVVREYLPAHGLTMVGAAHERYPEPGNPEHVQLWFPIARGYLFCQSCGMPLTKPADLGTEKDGEPCYDYCSYCYKDGSFTGDPTMEQMIELCIPMLVGEGLSPDAESARREMNEWFPSLKRWKKA